MQYTYDLETDVYNMAMEKIAYMNKDATIGFNINRGRRAYRNVLKPAFQGFIGRGIAQSPILAAAQSGAHKLDKIPILNYSGKLLDWVHDTTDRLGKANIPDNRMAKTFNNIGATVGTYDGVIGALASAYKAWPYVSDLLTSYIA